MLRSFKPLLKRPQGCQGCQKNQKDLRITTTIRFCANSQPKLTRCRKTSKINKKIVKKWRFLVIFQIFLNFGLILVQKRTMVVILRFFRFFWQPCCRMLERLFWLYQCSRNTCNCYRFILRSTSLWCELHLWNFKFLCPKLVKVNNE
jgi:hypothetical protein